MAKGLPPLGIVVLALCGLAVAALPGEGESDSTDELHLLPRITAFCKAYSTRKGAGMIVTDDDIKCVLQLGYAMRKEKERPALVQQVSTLYRLVVHLSPRCKVGLLAKSRMYFTPEFAKGIFSIVLNQDMP